MRRTSEPKTDGERLLASYLTDVRGWLEGVEWQYEPLLDGRRRRPDFRLRLGGWRCMLEVKEFGPSEPPAEGAPPRGRHERINGKIHAGRRQMREFQRDHICAVVLLSGAAPETDVDDPAVTMGALVGDPGFRLHRGAAGVPPPRCGPPVAAVITLHPVVRDGRVVGVGVRILENPQAERRFPSHLFQGPWDECWVVDDDGLRREFAGRALREAAAAPEPGEIAA